jgi:preprotein translocase subunit YajC
MSFISGISNVMGRLPLVFAQATEAGADAVENGAEPMGEEPTLVQMLVQLAPMMILIFAFFYVFSLRPQQKRVKDHEALLNGLKAGDTVLTTGGVVGKIVEIKDKFVKLEISEGVQMTFVRQSIRDQVSDDKAKS